MESWAIYNKITGEMSTNGAIIDRDADTISMSNGDKTTLLGYINSMLADNPELSVKYWSDGTVPDPATQRINPTTLEIELIPELDLKRPKKLEGISNAQLARQNAGFVCKNEIKLQIREIDLARWIQAQLLLQVTGAPSIVIRDADNINHTVSAEEYHTMMVEMGAYMQQQILGKYWSLKDAVTAAQTIEELDAIVVD